MFILQTAIIFLSCSLRHVVGMKIRFLVILRMVMYFLFLTSNAICDRLQNGLCICVPIDTFSFNRRDKFNFMQRL